MRAVHRSPRQPGDQLAALDDLLMWTEPGLESSLVTLATAQRGFVTTVQANSVGVSAYMLAQAVRRRRLLHPARGLYCLASAKASTDEEWHRQLSAGIRLLYPDGVFTSVSAVLAHDLPVWNVSLAKVELLRPVDRAVRLGAARVRPGSPDSIETAIGPAVDVGPAVVQVAVDFGCVQGVVCADAALHRKLLSRDDLVSAVAAVSSWPRASRAKAMLDLVDARTESVGESLTRVAAYLGGLELVPQVEIRDGRGRFVARVDFRVKGTKLLVEFDGQVKYADGDPQTLWAEKRREDALRSLGYVVVRITWQDLQRPGAVAAKIRRAMLVAQAG